MPHSESISRSHFLRNGFSAFVDCVSDAAETSVRRKMESAIIPLHRPPGAVEELSFLALCTRCDACIEACPEQALTRADTKHGAAIGTPMIDPSTQPCHLCDGYPCIQVCEEKALQPGAAIDMGTAHLIHNKCLAYQGQICDYCYQYCPLKNSAITMATDQPRINEAVCNGCGMCEYLCPAPGKAILVAPRRGAVVERAVG